MLRCNARHIAWQMLNSVDQIFERQPTVFGTNIDYLHGAG